ncbi:MAG: C39 family peptidase [Candidatus Berkelbacteria bacterium]
MKKTFYIILLLLVATSGFLFKTPVFASTLSDLKKEQAALDRQIQANRSAISSKQIQANDIQGTINNLSDQIDGMQKDIDYSLSKINLTNQQISATESSIDANMVELKKQKDSLYETIRAYYENQSPSTLEIVVSSNSLSDILNKSQYLDSISEDLNKQITSINKTMSDLQAQKVDLESQKSDLETQKDILVQQQNGIQIEQQNKAGILSNTKSAIADLQNQQKAAQARIDEINNQMAVLTGKSNWGSQIVSQEASSWYYMQTGNYTRLGRSPYTVSSYGCLITSIAMIDTYYGKKMTPTNIAQMWWLFDREGYLNSTAIPGVSVGPSQPIDWNTVNSELSSKHPVIVSIYLPSVGAINRDGSSHFIVIKGVSGGKYLMHDPIGPGRSYNLNQVRSMKIVRPS